jgi:hypothetical protein
MTMVGGIIKRMRKTKRKMEVTPDRAAPASPRLHEYVK